MEKLTHSRMACLKDCPRKHYWRYEARIRPREDSEALRIGSLLHEGLETREIPEKPEYPEWVIGNEEAENKWDVTFAKVAGLLLGYFEYWEDDDCEVLATELEFEMPIKNPETGGVAKTSIAAGKIDKIVTLPKKMGGGIALMEHKSTSDSIAPDSDYWLRLKLDQQISLYWIAAVEEGYDIGTVLYDVIKKPGIRPKQIPVCPECDAPYEANKDGICVSCGVIYGKKKDKRVESPDEYQARLVNDIRERPEFYFARKEIPRLRVDLEEFEVELWQQHRQLSDLRKFDRWYRNTSRCSAPWRCEYLDVCGRGHKAEDGVPDGFVTAEQHPELKG